MEKDNMESISDGDWDDDSDVVIDSDDERCDSDLSEYEIDDSYLDIPHDDDETPAQHQARKEKEDYDHPKNKRFRWLRAVEDIGSISKILSDFDRTLSEEAENFNVDKNLRLNEWKTCRNFHPHVEYDSSDMEIEDYEKLKLGYVDIVEKAILDGIYDNIISDYKINPICGNEQYHFSITYILSGRRKKQTTYIYITDNFYYLGEYCSANQYTGDQKKCLDKIKTCFDNKRRILIFSMPFLSTLISKDTVSKTLLSTVQFFASDKEIQHDVLAACFSDSETALLLLWEIKRSDNYRRNRDHIFLYNSTSNEFIRDDLLLECPTCQSKVDGYTLPKDNEEVECYRCSSLLDEILTILKVIDSRGDIDGYCNRYYISSGMMTLCHKYDVAVRVGNKIGVIEIMKSEDTFFSDRSVVKRRFCSFTRTPLLSIGIDFTSNLLQLIMCFIKYELGGMKSIQASENEKEEKD